MSTTATTITPVSLISVTPNAEELIAYCARVSNPSNQSNKDSEKLIRYLIEHKHWSPFEMGHLVMEINTDRAIAAQILRHRSFSFQEFSQRYATALPQTPEPPLLRRQDETNRQNSVDDLPEDTVHKLQTRSQILFMESRKLYEEMLANNVARECARAVLPLATPTRLYMAGSIRSWIHYVDLRVGNGTQKEHRTIALECQKVFSKALPSVSKALWQL